MLKNSIKTAYKGSSVNWDTAEQRIKDTRHS